MLLWLSLALAQDVNGHGYAMNPSVASPTEGLATWRAQAFTPGQVSVLGLFEYAEAPLVRMREYTDGSQERTPLLDDVFALNLGATVGIHERVGVSVHLPLFITTAGDAGRAGPAMGDPRLSVPVSLLASDLSLSVVPYVDLPVGAGGRYLGDAGVGAGGLLAARYTVSDFDIAANLGAEVTGAAELANLPGAGRLIAGLGAGYAFGDTLGVQLEAQVRPTLVGNDVKGTDTPAELIGSLRAQPKPGLSVIGGAASGLSRGATAARFRVFAGVGMSFGGGVDDAGPEDGLGELKIAVIDPTGAPVGGAFIKVDGVSHAADETGVYALSNLAEGQQFEITVKPPPKLPLVPSEATTATATGAEQTITIELPYAPGQVHVRVRADGKPIPATVFFQGPTEVEATDIGGAETFKLAPGEWDVAVTAEGFGSKSQTVTVPPGGEAPVEIRFELESAAVEVTREEVVALTQILFEYDSAEIRSESLPILDEVAANLLAIDDIEKAEVQGHTDGKGEPDYNLELSQRRVDAVVAYLVGRGVEPSRLLPKGYGESCPLESNDTDAGRAENRRVQFIILEPAPKGAIPCHDGEPARRAAERTFVLPGDETPADDGATEPSEGEDPAEPTVPEEDVAEPTEVEPAPADPGEGSPE